MTLRQKGFLTCWHCWCEKQIKKIEKGKTDNNQLPKTSAGVGVVDAAFQMGGS